MILIMVALAAMSVSAQTLTTDNYYLDGIWHDRNYDQELEIQYDRNGIRVKRRGLFRKTKRFRVLDERTYADRDGNVIELINRNKLIWKNRGDREYRVFFKQGRYDTDRRIRADRYSDRPYASRTRGNGRVGSYYGSRVAPNSRGRLDGRWECGRGRNQLYIESFDGGFRSRRSRNGNWLNFYQDRNNPNAYRCDNGERYEFRNDELRWYGRNSCDNLRFRRRR